MDRTELEKYIRNNYGTEPDHPWIKYPNYGVFRHSSNKKWFAGGGWKRKRAVNHMKIHGSFQSVKKVRLAFCVSCGSTHKIEFAKQIHKFREHVSRNLYKGRKNVPVGRGFSSVSLESVVSSERLLGKR